MNQALKDPIEERKPGGCATSAWDITGQENRMHGCHVIGSFGLQNDQYDQGTDRAKATGIRRRLWDA